MLRYARALFGAWLKRALAGVSAYGVGVVQRVCMMWIAVPVAWWLAYCFKSDE